jgi:hypothetical protein
MGRLLSKLTFSSRIMRGWLLGALVAILLIVCGLLMSRGSPVPNVIYLLVHFFPLTIISGSLVGGIIYSVWDILVADTSDDHESAVAWLALHLLMIVFFGTLIVAASRIQ